MCRIACIRQHCKIVTHAHAADISLEKTLPNNLEAERSILGAILLDDKAVFTVFETLRKRGFLSRKPPADFREDVRAAASARPIDLVTLKDELQRADELESAGGAAYLASLTDGLPRAINIEHYAQIVKEKSTLRRLIQISNETMARSYQDEESAEEILQHVEKAIFDLASQQFRTGFSPIEPLVSDVFKQIEEVSNRKTPVTGLETGFVGARQDDGRPASRRTSSSSPRGPAWAKPASASISRSTPR